MGERMEYIDLSGDVDRLESENKALKKTIKAQQQEIKELQAEIWELKGALQDRSKSCIAFDAENAQMREALVQAKEILQSAFKYYEPHILCENIKLALKEIDKVLNQSDNSNFHDSTQNNNQVDKLSSEKIDKRRNGK